MELPAHAARTAGNRSRRAGATPAAAFAQRLRLPEGKTLAALEESRLSAAARRQLVELCEGHFAERALNVLAFGLPGRGKTHFLSAVGYELIQRHSKRLLFVPSYKLIQRLLEAKRELKLEALLKKLDGYAVTILDDLGIRANPRGDGSALHLLRGTL
jgi:DNA replication protein DnaC